MNGDAELAKADGHDAAQCRKADESVGLVFAVLGKRWNGVIIATLMNGPAHFAELRRAIEGISERMLADRLAELAEAGLVDREVQPGPPLRVSYSLTAAGEGLRPALAELRSWAQTCLRARSGAADAC
jgi:DNA-binding HxlR family transcriptional regulator